MGGVTTDDDVTTLTDFSVTVLKKIAGWGVVAGAGVGGALVLNTLDVTEETLRVVVSGSVLGGVVIGMGLNPPKLVWAADTAVGLDFGVGVDLLLGKIVSCFGGRKPGFISFGVGVESVDVCLFSLVLSATGLSGLMMGLKPVSVLGGLSVVGIYTGWGLGTLEAGGVAVGDTTPGP